MWFDWLAGGESYTGLRLRAVKNLIGTGCDAARVERRAHGVDFRVALETGIGTEFR